MDAVTLLERVAAELQNPTTRSAAEEALLSFRVSHACLEGARAVLDSATASAGAKFQAALALRGAVLSRWHELSPATIDALRRYLLDKLLVQQQQRQPAVGDAAATVAAAEAAGERLVRTQLLAAHACILKRAWGCPQWTDDDRRAALSELEAAAAGGAGAKAAAVALASLDAVVSEFSPATASPLGQPWEYHESCRRSMQRDWLPRMLELSIGASAAAVAAAVGGAGGASGGASVGLPTATPVEVDADAAAAAEAALSLTSTILSWDFSGLALPGTGAAVAAASNSSSPDASVVSICPGPAFRGLLLRSPAVESLLSTTPLLKSAASASSPKAAAAASRLYSGARQVVVLLCGLDGSIFPSALPPARRSAAAASGAAGSDPGAAQAAAAEAAAAREEGRRARAEHSSSMLRAVVPWAWPPTEAARAAQNFENDGSELADACRALSALAAAQGAAALAEIPVSVPSSASTAAAAGSNGAATPTATISGLSALAEVTVACLVAGGADGDAEGKGGPAGDASAALLDGWVDAVARDEREARVAIATSFCSPSSSSSSPRPGPLPVPRAVSEASARVFSALVAAELAPAAARAAEDEDEGEATAAADLDDGGGASSSAELAASRAAEIGRTSASSSCATLSQAIAAVRGELARATSTRSDPSVPLEQLVWLSRAAAALLADAPDDGDPSVPERISEASTLSSAASSSSPSNDGGGDPVLSLSSSLLELAALVGGAPAPSPSAPSPPSSPRLLEALSLALSRWAATYLLPDLRGHQEERPYPPSLASAYGGSASGGSGEATLAGLSRLAVTWLASTPGEEDLHSAVSRRLLPSLSRRCEASEALLARGVSPEWSALAEAFSHPGPSGGAPPALYAALESLSEPLHRSLGASLARVGAGAPDAESAASYVSRLSAGPTGRLSSIAEGLGGPAPAAALLGGAAGSACVRAAEAWRGLVRGCPPRARPALASAFGRDAAGAVSRIASAAARSAGSCPRVAKALLRLAADAVDSLAPHAPTPSDGAALARWALGIARGHAASRKGFVAAAASARLREAEADDGERELRALLKLVASLASRAAVADVSDAAGDDGSSCVFSAFESLLPLVTAEALSYPKLSAAYYGLLGDVLETWPERVPTLPPDLGAALVSSLDAGAASADERSSAPCLEALGSLARWAAKTSSTAAQGSPEAAAAQHLGSALAQRFVGPLLARMLLIDGKGGGGSAVATVSRASTDACADALLPLASAAPLAWKEACDALVASVESDAGGAANGAAAAAAAGDRVSRLRAVLAALEAGARPDDGGAVASAAAASNRRPVDTRAAQERAVRRKFRAAMAKFVADARGIVRTC